MVLSPDMLGVLLYCAQQLGVTLAVGAQTVLLVQYLSDIRDGVIDKTEERLARAVQNVAFWGVVLIILSGIAVTLMHAGAGESAVIFEPAYLFKWALIVLVLVLGASWYKLPQSLLNGLAGGTWYALFLVHVLAPVTTWANLLTLYVVWMVGFNLCWWAVVFIFKPHAPKQKSEVKKSMTPPPAPKTPPPSPKLAPATPPPQPVAPPPAPPKPAFTPPAPEKPMMPRPLSAGNTLPLQKDPLVVPKAGLSAAPTPAPEAPAVKKELPPGVMVMPKSPGDLPK